MSLKLITLKEVLLKTTLSRSGVYEGIAKRTFPPQIVLSPRRVAWCEKAIDEWVQARIDGKAIQYDTQNNGGSYE